MSRAMSIVNIMMEGSVSYDIAVVGGGPAGIAAAIALAQSGGNVVLIARRAAYADNRTTALLGASVDFLQRLDVWQGCADKAAPLKTMRLVDDTGRLIRAPEVKFSCEEIGLETFGYNIENRTLVAALEERAAALPNLARLDDEAETVTPDDLSAAIHTTGGRSLSARLVIGADGRLSLCREAAGIAVTSRDLGQAALTFNVSHARPHQNVSTEFHTPEGPCVFVPLPGDRCSVVWVASPKQAELLYALSDEALSEAAEKQSLDPRPHEGRAGPVSVSTSDRTADAIREGAHCAGWRSSPCDPANRRAGPQHGTARCRGYRRHRARCDCRGR